MAKEIDFKYRAINEGKKVCGLIRAFTSKEAKNCLISKGYERVIIF